MCISTSKCIKRRKNKVKDIKQNAKLTFFKETNKNSNRLNSFSTIDFQWKVLKISGHEGYIKWFSNEIHKTDQSCH